MHHLPSANDANADFKFKTNKNKTSKQFNGYLMDYFHFVTDLQPVKLKVL